MKPKLLILYPKYGLANRLRSLASAKILADYTGRKLFCNWYPSKECNIEWEDLFVDKLERYPFPLSSFQVGTNRYDDENNDDKFYWDMPRSLICNRSDAIAVHTCFNFQPEGMTSKAYNEAKSIFYRGLHPVYEVAKNVDEIYKNRFEGNEVVGVHIRRTDHLSFIKKDPRLVCPTDIFTEMMWKILKNNPKTKFFLATDDKKEEKRICRMFQGAVIVYEKKVVNRDTDKGMKDALIDWLLLSKTSRIIGSYLSTFSEEAGIVNMIKSDFILRTEELSKPHYNTILKEYLKPHWVILKNEGLNKYFLYSYNYRKGQFTNWFRKKISL